MCRLPGAAAAVLPRHGEASGRHRTPLVLGIATLFAVGLLAAGLASTLVNAYASAEIMQDCSMCRIPLIARRLVPLRPAIAVLWLGFDPTLLRVLSQTRHCASALRDLARPVDSTCASGPGLW